jgi:acetyltransferase-like isoleucine patch superfamily enzyme
MTAEYSELLKLPGKVYLVSKRFHRKLLKIILKPLFKECGKNFRFDPTNSIFSYNTIVIGNDVMIGSNAVFIASESSIIIGNQVVFAPNVTIRGGNHNIGVMGKYMYQVREKREIDDQPVVIEDDVWVGSNVTILKGVKIGRGSVLAAGAVVTKNVPPYAIIAGIPAEVIKWRWTVEEIIEHEEKLYAPDKRFSETHLKDIQEIYGSKRPQINS